MLVKHIERENYMNNLVRTTPSILFKYRDDSVNTEKIITNNKVWLSSPDNLNDPFECRIGEIPRDWETKTIRMMEEGQIMGMISVFPTFQPPKTLYCLNERATKQWLKRFRNLDHSRKVKAMRALQSDHGVELSRPQDVFKDMRERLAKLGVFSLSETSVNELMWAHYGQNHRGIAFGFSTSGNCKLAQSRHCLPVEYVMDKPIFKEGFSSEVQIMAPGSGIRNVHRVSFEDTTFRSTISTKTPSWAYEMEWRYIEETSGLFDFPGELNQVIFGLRMTKERRDFYRDLVLKHVNSKVCFYEVYENSKLNGIELRELRY